MNDLPPPYPLCWPDNIRRTKTSERSPFRTELPKAIKNVESSLRLFGSDTGKSITRVSVTSNVGLMGGTSSDTGVAVWFEWDGAVRCIACDRYLTVKDNLQAVHHVLEARRTEMRHAGLEMTRASFRGFTPALLAGPVQTPWHSVLGVKPTATKDEIAAAYKAKARDLAARGDDLQLKELNVARDAAMKAAG